VSIQKGIEYDHEATGFFVALLSPKECLTYGYIVTAAHVARRLTNKRVGFIVNSWKGGITAIEISGSRWFFHPTDLSVDVAVLPCEYPHDADLIAFSTQHFLTAERMEKEHIGLGDEVVFPGLFTFAPGRERIQPLLRHGTIAMLPDEPIQVKAGFAQVYLIEARSIGGLSGSPVLVRGTIAIPITPVDENNQSDFALALSSKTYLLGLTQDHWDISESELNNTKARHVAMGGVNMEIGVVVPAIKILEILGHPELVAMRASEDEKLRSAVTPTQDGG
jgi:hypothetical protein